MKYYEIVERLNDIDNRAIKKAVYDEYHKINIAYYESFIQDPMINLEIIKYLAGEYYLASQFLPNKQYIRKFIEKNYNNDDKLYAAFLQKNDFSKDLINNYINHNIKFDRFRNILKLKNDKKLDIGIFLNPYMLSEGHFQYLTDEYNYYCKNFVVNIMMQTDLNSKHSESIQECISSYPNTFFQCLFSNAYKVLTFKKMFQITFNKNIISIMERKPYEEIKALFLTDSEFFMNVCYNTFEYYYLPNDILEKMNLIILKRDDIRQQLKKLNSLYIIELISDFDMINYQKKIKK